jgi:plasmid stabilization system protein ParE
MTYRLITLPRAERGAWDAYHWLAERAPEAAHRWYRELREAIESLATHPQRCPLAPENEHAAEEIRQLLYGRHRGVYRILFTVEADTVYVLTVRHGARQSLPPDALTREEEVEE